MGLPTQVCLVDFQVCNVGSLMQDIMMLLFSSLSIEDRKEKTNYFLDIYYKSFCEIFRLTETPVPFCRQELQEEYTRLQTYGIFLGIMSLPSGIKTEDFDELERELGESRQIYDERTLNKMQTIYSFKNDPMFKSRVLALLQDVISLDIMNM